LRANEKRTPALTAFYEAQWTLEEATFVLQLATQLGILKGSENLDAHVREGLLADPDSYSEKAFVIESYCNAQIARKKLKREHLHEFLQIINLYVDVMKGDENCQVVLRKALYVIEDNMKPGNEQYDEDRRLLERLVYEHTDVINKEKDKELKEIRDLERLEREIQQGLIRA